MLYPGKFSETSSLRTDGFKNFKIKNFTGADAGKELVGPQATSSSVYARVKRFSGAHACWKWAIMPG